MGGRCARAVIVACLMLLCGLTTLDGLDGGGMARGRPTMLGGEFAGGSGTADDPYLITNVYELQNMTKDLGAHYVLENDIDAGATRGWNDGAGFEPVGAYANAFTGSLEGRNHTISGLYINRSGTVNVGLFGYVDLGTVKDVGLINDEVIGDEAVGGLVGFSRSTVSNCYATGNVNGNYEVGGLMGHIQYRTVSNCYATGNVTGYGSVGGLVGLTYYTVSSCNATGNVTGYTRVGGLVGYSGMYGTVSNCYATGNVNGTLFVGGLVGEIATDTMSNCYATGNVTGYVNVGGLVGYTGTSRVTVSNCYATGNVTGSIGVGGLMGSTSCKVSNSFWDVESSGIGTSYGGTGRTTAEMRTRSTFTDAGWDFDGVWCILENVTYPLLRWQDAEPPSAHAGPDQTVDEGTNVTFNGSASSDDLWIAELAWVFVDGSPMTLNGPRPSHVFDDPGTFVVTLNVTDAVGRWAVDTVNITVNDITMPVADAGPDQTVDEGTLVTFDGGGSTDNVGIANYTWTLTDGTIVILYDTQPMYLFENPGTFAVVLNVTDAASHWATDTVTITVRDVTPPESNAGPDQTVDEGTVVTFDGSGSKDNIGVVELSWAFTDGVIVVLRGARPAHQFDNPGTFVVVLNVTDAAGNWHTDTMTITVTDVTPPEADAGPDRTVDERTLVTLDGSGSTDNVGVVEFTWTLTDGEPVTLHGDRPTHLFATPGVFVVTLTLTDAAGNQATDTVTVTVRDATPPVADAGPDQTVDEGTLVTFDGSGSADNVGIADLTWTLDPGTGTVILHGSAPTFTFILPGIYMVTLTATDAAGLSHEDTMTVTVRDVTPPTADAGTDRRVPVGSDVQLDASPSTDNVGISAYSWDFTYDGQARTLTGATVQFTFDKAGTYELTLTVIDLAGNTGEDTTVITVVGTGTVTGTVLDKGGRSVEGATVRVTAPDGSTCNATTAADGTFSLDVPHGAFAWKVSKKGYKDLTGSGSVGPMDATELDLSGKPLVKEEGKSPGAGAAAAVAALAVACQASHLFTEGVRSRGRSHRPPSREP